jgi:hypothetical protein
MLGIKATKGERVSVETVAQQRLKAKQNSGGNVINVEVNLGFRDVDNLKQSEQQVLMKFAGKLGKALENV